MTTMTIRLPDAEHERLKLLAESRGVSVNEVIEEITTRGLTEFHLETRFRVGAARGDVVKALALMDRFDTE
jgi:predicted DNA-binding protein